MTGVSIVKSVGRPSQIKFVRPAQMERFAKIVCFPPLSQMTVIPAEQRRIEFTACLQSSKALPETGWEVSVWHNCPTKSSRHAGVWKDLPLALSTSQPFRLIDAAAPDSYCYTFSAVLELDSDSSSASVANFTIKFRAGSTSKWQWVQENFGTADGTLVGCSSVTDGVISSWASSTFGDDFLQDWTISSMPSQAPGANLFKVESRDWIPRDGVDDAKYETKVFGSSHVGFCRYMALVRIWTPWLAPRQGERRFHITEDALLCSFLKDDGRHLVLLPVNGIHDTVTVFRSDDQGHLVVAARNDGLAEAKFEFLVAVADDFETANAAAMYAARDMVVNTGPAINDALEPAPKPQWLEEWYDGLTYCTWNSLGQDLTAVKIFAALDDLAANDIHVSGLIIDDNWQSLDGQQGKTSQFHRGWTDFDANKEGFPEGLKSTVSKIKTLYPAIKNVAVWHGLHGYWGGISPSGDIAKRYKTIEVEKQAGIAGGKMLAIDPSEVRRFYDDFYRFLSSAGITSVKADVQFYLDLLAATPDRRAFMTEYQSAWTIAHLRHFGGKAISCMSQIPQILFQSFLPTTSPRVLLRNSDDFFPTIPASHPWHIFCNAHNSLFVQHLNVLPDWDMFQTSHPYSGFHAAARCVSGGPIYVTDTPGEHDLDLVSQMTAKSVRGQTVILRPSVIGKSISIYDQYHEGHILKIGTYNGAAQTGNGILGLFNVSDHEISAMVPITDFPGVKSTTAAATIDRKTESASDIRPSHRFIIRSHILNLISQPIVPSSPPPASNLISTTLPVRGYDILTVYPLYDVPLHPPGKQQQQQQASKTTSIAVLGLLGSMTGACAITSTNFEPVSYNSNDNRELKLHVSLKALGTLGIWMSDLGRRNLDASFLVTIQGQVVPRERVKKKTQEHDPSSTPSRQPDSDGSQQAGKNTKEDGVLEIDVLGAWKDMQLHGGWANEVAIAVLVQD